MDNTITFTLELDGKQYLATARLADDAAKGLDKSIGGVNKKAGEGVGALNGLAAQVGKLALSYVSLNAVLQVMSATMRTAMEEAIEYERSLSSATAAANRAGISQQVLLDAVDELGGGLLDEADSLNALKDLLSAGFGMREAITLTKQFSDIALVNAENNVSVAENVKAATEAIKNGNARQLTAIGLGAKITTVLKEQGVEEMNLANVRNNASLRLAFLKGITEEYLAVQDRVEERLKDIDTNSQLVSLAYKNFAEELGKGTSALGERTGILDGLVTGFNKLADALNYLRTSGDLSNWTVKMWVPSLREVSTESDAVTKWIQRIQAAQEELRKVQSAKHTDRMKELESEKIALKLVTDGIEEEMKWFAAWKEKLEETAEVHKEGRDAILESIQALDDAAADSRMALGEEEVTLEEGPDLTALDEAAEHRKQKEIDANEQVKDHSRQTAQYVSNVVGDAWMYGTQRGKKHWDQFLNYLIRSLVASGLKQMILSLFNIGTGGGGSVIGKILGLAGGAVIDEPTLAVIGEENKPEIVAPQQDFLSFASGLAEAIRGQTIRNTINAIASSPIVRVQGTHATPGAASPDAGVIHAIRRMEFTLQEAIRKNRPVFAGDLNDETLLKRQNIERFRQSTRDGIS